jgi:hypothetical protein
MAKKVKYGKVAIVIFITALIWVWADLAQDDTYTVPHATITIAKSVDPGLWVTFGEVPSFTIDDIVLKGPVSKIAEVERELNDGSLTFDFVLDPARQEMSAVPGRHPLDLQSFLRKNKLIKKYGLTVESCSPRSITVRVIKLVENTLKVRCMADDRIPIKDATIDPTHVKMFVPVDWAGEKLAADVHLTPREITYARTAAIDGTPQIELAPGQFRKAKTSVKIKMPAEEEKLRGYNITSATIGFVFSPVLQEKYRVELLNPQDMAMVRIKATADAKSAYESQQPFQILLYILDGDEKKKGGQSRKVVYDLPQEFVGKGEIVLNQQPVTARFKLVPRAPEPGPSPGS